MGEFYKICAAGLISLIMMLLLEKQEKYIRTIYNKANDMDLPYVIGPRRDGDLPAFWADAEKAKNLLGWEATHTVEDMCRSAWQFAKNAGK